MANSTTVLIVGNTYPVKDQLKALGGRWDATAKGWRVPAAAESKAKALVGGAPRTFGTAGRSAPATQMAPKTGCYCGSRHGVSRRNDCASCRYDAM